MSKEGKIISELKFEPVETGKTVTENGTIKYFIRFDSMTSTVPHRNDGPAVIYENGTEEWWVNGLLHRMDGPAIKYSNDKNAELFAGGEEWYQFGIMHRADGPALINEFKTEWFFNGVHHRIGGPAIERIEKLCKGSYYSANKKWLDPHSRGLVNTILTDKPQNTQQSIKTKNIAKSEWWINGKLHRWEGPAIEYWGPETYYLEHREEYWVDGCRLDKLKDILEDCQITGDPSSWTEGEFMVLRLALSEELAKSKK